MLLSRLYGTRIQPHRPSDRLIMHRKMTRSAISARDDKTITSDSFFSEHQSYNCCRSSVNLSLSEQEELPFDTAEDGPSGSASGPLLLSESSTSQEQQEHQAEMAPQRPNLLPKDRFALAFGSLKTQSYYHPIARAPGSHTYASSIEFEQLALNLLLTGLNSLIVFAP